MMFDIPNELIPYVRLSKKRGLLCSEDMPAEMMPIYLEAKEKYDLEEKARVEDLKSLIVESGNE